MNRANSRAKRDQGTDKGHRHRHKTYRHRHRHRHTQTHRRHPWIIRVEHGVKNCIRDQHHRRYFRQPPTPEIQNLRSTPRYSTKASGK